MSNELDDIHPDIDAPGPGETRLEPVEVDVLDNLINAQAGYMEALAVAAEHYDLEFPDEVLGKLAEAWALPVGLIMAGIAGRRV